MSRIVGVQFKQNGPVYDFDSGHFVLKKGDKVMVITEQGPALGCVCMERQMRVDPASERPLQKVFRLATPEEMERFERGCALETEVYGYCYEAIRRRELPMSLVAVERQFDGAKVTVYFTADGRIDFRELVKDLVRRFRTRIEMRQIGVRHQAKMVGGLGSCGRPLCCTSFLEHFAPVTIRMAKEQSLSLSPNKISGMCGRLMCCLAYEHELYEEMKKGFPKTGKRVTTRHGSGKIVRQNVLRDTVTVALDAGREIDVPNREVQPAASPTIMETKE
jgi:cell fate regulator YaaT (PSP1 superfamily)